MIFFLFFLGFLIYVWLGYPLLLWFGGLFFGRVRLAGFGKIIPHISILVAAHNEAATLPERIENIFESNYPQDHIEVVVASDGSTDATVSVCKELKKKFPAVRVLDLQPQQGRAEAHNRGVPECTGDIVVFTDADTLFAPHFLRSIIDPFTDLKIGFASGILNYENVGENAVTESVGLYWRFEMLLRRLEDRLGVYVFGSGACCAVRRELFKSLPPTGDVDFTTPLDVVLAGYKCAHVAKAIAFDSMPSTPRKEFQARVRMTAKNFSGTISRWGFGGFAFHPLYSLVLFSHKLGRWLTPFCLIGILLSSGVLVGKVPWALPLLLLQLAFYSLAVAGFFRVRIPFASQAFSFSLANAAFLVGIGKILLGRVPKAYKPVGHC